MTEIVFRGTKIYRPWYLNGGLLNKVNQRIAKRNIDFFPQLAIYSFDNIGLVINLEGRYESDSLEILSHFLVEHLCIDTDSVAVDVGANIGNHSVFFSKFFRSVLAFEPNPRVFNLLKFNSEGTNITPLNFGLSNENCSLKFCIDRINLGASKVVDSGASESPSEPVIVVEVRKLDDSSEIQDQAVSLIKIDVEGHELQVLEGAQRLIETARPVIIFEQGEDSIAEGSSEVIEFLREKRYRFFTIQNNFQLGRGRVARAASLTLRIMFGYCKEIAVTNYFEKRFYDMIIAVPESVRTTRSSVY